MKPTATAAATTSALVALGVTACSTTTIKVPAPAPTPSAATPSRSAPATPGPSLSGAPQAAPATHAQASSPAPATQAPAAPPATVPDVTNPWAVVSAYYGDVESGDFQQAWALINDGATTGQTYQQFVNGYACTGAQQLSEVGESGDQVTFDLAATNSCTGQVQDYSGTDTVQNGKIVAADVHQTN